MKNRIRKVTAILACTAMVFGLAACGSKEEAPAAAAASSAPAAEAVKSESAAPAATDGKDWTQGEKREIKIATLLTESSVSGKALQKFADDINAKSGGRIVANVYYNGVLADYQSAFEMEQEGDIQMTTENPLVYETMLPTFATLDEYFLFDDLDHVHRFLEGEGGEIMNKAWNDAKLEGLCAFGLGFRELSNNKKEVHNMADMKGLTLRGYSTIQIDAWNAAGAAPTSVDWNELFVSMQQGLLDGQESALSTIYDFSFYEVQKYITLTDHVWTADWVVCNKEWLEGLGDDEQLVRETMNEAYEWQKEAYQAEIENYIKFFEEKGIVITEMTPEDKAELKEAMAPTTAKSVIETCGQETYDKIHELVEAAR
ncbi:MAG: TRAP transporter substrate-binding protein [Eubacteriales bacterium]|nr:TRAP transporter substrate-binding protein [Eubacteriales bacterium]